MSAKPYQYLRQAMKEKGIEQSDLCYALDRSSTYITARIQGRMPWLQNEQYAIMDMLGEPYDRLHIVFPPKGKTLRNQRDCTSEARAAILSAIQILSEKVAKL